jgi:hypothetical protein
MGNPKHGVTPRRVPVSVELTAGLVIVASALDSTYVPPGSTIASFASGLALTAVIASRSEHRLGWHAPVESLVVVTA